MKSAKIPKDSNSGIVKCHTLSNLRQQFNANMKSLMDKDQVAEICGCKSTNSTKRCASEDYARIIEDIQDVPFVFRSRAGSWESELFALMHWLNPD